MHEPRIALLLFVQATLLALAAAACSGGARTEDAPARESLPALAVGEDVLTWEGGLTVGHRTVVEATGHRVEARHKIGGPGSLDPFEREHVVTLAEVEAQPDPAVGDMVFFDDGTTIWLVMRLEGFDGDHALALFGAFPQRVKASQLHRVPEPMATTAATCRFMTYGLASRFRVPTRPEGWTPAPGEEVLTPKGHWGWKPATVVRSDGPAVRISFEPGWESWVSILDVVPVWERWSDRAVVGDYVSKYGGVGFPVERHTETGVEGIEDYGSTTNLDHGAYFVHGPSSEIFVPAIDPATATCTARSFAHAVLRFELGVVHARRPEDRPGTVEFIDVRGQVLISGTVRSEVDFTSDVSLVDQFERVHERCDREGAAIVLEEEGVPLLIGDIELHPPALERQDLNPASAALLQACRSSGASGSGQPQPAR